MFFFSLSFPYSLYSLFGIFQLFFSNKFVGENIMDLEFIKKKNTWYLPIIFKSFKFVFTVLMTIWSSILVCCFNNYTNKCNKNLVYFSLTCIYPPKPPTSPPKKINISMFRILFCIENQNFTWTENSDIKTDIQ